MCAKDYSNNSSVCAAIRNNFKTTKGSLHGNSRNNKFSEFYLRIENCSSGYLYLELRMVGNLNRNEPPRCENWKSERKVWRRLHRHDFTNYMEKLHRSRNSVSYGFAKSWSNNRATLFGEIWQIDENLIAEVTGLKTEGTKFYRDRKYAAEAFKISQSQRMRRASLRRRTTSPTTLPSR